MKVGFYVFQSKYKKDTIVVSIDIDMFENFLDNCPMAITEKDGRRFVKLSISTKDGKPFAKVIGLSSGDNASKQPQQIKDEEVDARKHYNSNKTSSNDELSADDVPF